MASSRVLALALALVSPGIALGGPVLTMLPCRPPGQDGLQRWSFVAGGLELLGYDGAEPGCVSYGGDGVPLVLRSCNASDSRQRWDWDAGSGAVRLAGSSPSVCFNVRTLAGPGAAPGNVGGYFPCTPSGVPHNEIFNKDSRGRLVSQMNGAWARQCVTVPGPTPPTPPYTGLSVWPIPREEAANGPTLDLAHSFAIEYGGESAVAAAAVARYTALLANKTAKTLSHSPSHTLYLSARKNGSPSSSTSPSSPGLPKLSLVLLSADDTLTNWTVNESYTLEVKGGAAVATAATPFGGLRALETFYQLVTNGATAQSLQLPHDTISIADAPSYGHRSLMLDTGRRLYPLPFVRSIVDAMSYAKLNVLHLHLNDMGRYAFESKIYPELNVGYLGDGTFWTQAEVKELVIYAKMRGVRVVPELEMSSHSKALLPLVKSRGLQFCNISFPTMLFDDPAGVSYGIIQELLAEMADLFIDEVVHLGMDEAQCYYSDPNAHDPLDVGMCGLGSPPRCNAETVRALQHRVLGWTAGPGLAAKLAVPRALRPMAWHNAFTDCGDLRGCALPIPVPPSTAGVPTTIVEVFSSASIGTEHFTGPELLANVTGSGYAAVMADAARLYLDTGSPAPAAYFQSLWDDIAVGLTTDKQRSLLLGGGMSLWSDAYCSGKVECGGWAYCPSGAPADSCVSDIGWMQGAKFDLSFIQSAGGLLFPRANVGAGAFWNYVPALAPDSAEVQLRNRALAASMAARGVLGLCDEGCTCSFFDRCGKPYTKPSAFPGAEL